MLKITNIGTATEQRWILCGQLTGPWVAELLSNWQTKRAESPGSRCVVDLSDVTFIDEVGERSLRVLNEEGAEFVATGVDTRDLLENLKANGKRSLRRFLAHRTDEGCTGKRY
jgi:hypothetical protein